MADDLSERLRDRLVVQTPDPDIESVRRRARILRVRRAAAAAAVSVVVGAAIAFPLARLAGLGADAPDVGGSSVSASASPEPSPEPSLSPSPSGDVLELVPGWFMERNPLPALIDPVIVVAAGSWDFPKRPLIACGSQPALEDMPPDGAFVWILRYTILPGEFLGRFRNAPPWPDRFSLDLPSRPSDGECVAGSDGSARQYYFTGGEDLYLQVQVVLGTEATPERRREVETILSSYRPD